MLNNTGARLVLKKEYLWTIALTIFFIINMNYEWRTGYIAWYGSLSLVMFSYFVTYDGLIQLKMTPFVKWIISFTVLGLFSVLWCSSSAPVIDIVKTYVVYIAVFLLIQFSINFGYKVDTMLRGYFVATLVNSIYVFLTIDVAKLGDVQIGNHLLDGWNGNGIGSMAAQGAFIGCYLFGQSKNKLSKIMYLCGMFGFSFLTFYTGSRTAFIMLVASFVMYFWLCNPTKIVRNAIITAVVLGGVLYLVMNVQSLYNVLGSRLEGLFSLFTGEGEVDSSADIRDVFIQNGKKWFVEKPILGYGLNNYRVLNQLVTGRYTYAHNTFIELAVNLGTVGLIWYYSVYLYLGKRFVSVFRKSALNRFLFASLAVSLISQYGTVSYYGFYQNFLLMLCFYAVADTNKKGLVN